MFRNHLRSLFTALFTALFALGLTLSASATPPDLTSGEVPTSSKNLNLGPTGMHGWLYHFRTDSSESRQILVTKVDTASPADGILAPDDVILGVDGTGAAPSNFISDARKSLAAAISAAEARDPATLQLLRWRAGSVTTVTLTLQSLGAYSLTAPYQCSKSALIREQAIQNLMSTQGAGRYSFNTLSLLAVNDPSDPNNAARLARAEAEALALIPSASEMALMTSNVVETQSKITWTRGHELIVLAEYYLVTGDSRVLPAIDAYTQTIVRGQSMFGTAGHQFAKQGEDGSVNGPYAVGYGPINSANMPCILGLALAKECGITTPGLELALENSSRYFAYYAGRGSIPYGEHEAYAKAHESNGKSGLATLIFALENNREPERKFFTQMATAAASEREYGHTGPYFNQLWAPLGAGVGGVAAAAEHFSRISWLLDLNRRWDGGFEFNTLNEGGNGGSAQWQEFYMSTATILTYAMPLRQLHLTGRGHDPAHWLTNAEVNQATFADVYDADSRTTAQLVTDLGNWSPKVQMLAAEEIGTRTSDHSSLLPTLTALANDPTGTSRIGACRTLGEIGDASSAAPLGALLTDPENHVRWAAAEALRYLPQSARETQLDIILSAAASTQVPVLPIDEEDPLQFAHARLGMLLFYSGNAYGPRGIIYDDLTGVDRSLLYPAIRAVAATPTGLARSTLKLTYRNLSEIDVLAVADAIVDSVKESAQADRMFSDGVREGGLDALQAYNISEGVPLSMIFIEDDGFSNTTPGSLNVLERYAASSNSVVPNPDVIAFCEELIARKIYATDAQAVLDAIVADSNPVTLTPLKIISSIVADSPVIDLPTKTTTLQVTSNDYAQGDSIYTWKKIHGAGQVFITPNGTAGAVNPTIVFDGTPGIYQFEVKMSDSRGLTEVYETAIVTLRTAGGTLPNNTPPSAIAQSITLPQATQTPITLSGTDPEGYTLTYRVLSQPANGTITGTAPYLVYTSDFTYTGADSFTFEAMDSEGQVSTETISLTVDPASDFEAAIYEPFDYPAGQLLGSSGSGEVGLTGSWTANTSSNITAGSLSHGSLVTNGGKISDLNGGSNHFGGARAISPSALAGNNLLDDGATLWFSAVVGYDTTGNLTNSRLSLALANSSLSTSNNRHWVNNEGSQIGSGIGLFLGRVDGNRQILATEFRDASLGNGTAGLNFGSSTGVGISYGEGQNGLIVGKITWGLTPSAPDTIELFQPGTDMVLPSEPISVLSTILDQSTFDTLSWARGDRVVLDEIRFGANYQSILLGTSAMTADLTAPAPDPISFALPPTQQSSSSITMIAATAFDPNGTEYFFTNTSGGGNDSGWQSSASYTDTGLTPGVTNSYTVMARDLSPAGNATAASSPASAIIANQVTAPDLIGMAQATAESIILYAGLSTGTISSVPHASIPAGEVISQNPLAESLVTVGTPVDLVLSAGSGTPLTIWISNHSLNQSDAALTADPDLDGVSNILEFGFGTDPAASDHQHLLSDGSKNGFPIIELAGNQMEYHFTRRDDHGTPGSALYTVQFSSDLGDFYDSTDTPTFVADSSAAPAYEIVKVPYPATLPNGNPPKYARLKVVANP